MNHISATVENHFIELFIISDNRLYTSAQASAAGNQRRCSIPKRQTAPEAIFFRKCSAILVPALSACAFATLATYKTDMTVIASCYDKRYIHVIYQSNNKD